MKFHESAQPYNILSYLHLSRDTTHSGTLFRILKPDKNSVAFYDEFLHLSHEAAFLSIKLWRSATM